MDHRRHVGQGWALLVTGVLIGAALLFMATLLAGLGPGTLAVGVLVLAAFGAGSWALWRSGRRRLAWALLLLGPGVALVVLVALFVVLMQAYGW